MYVSCQGKLKKRRMTMYHRQLIQVKPILSSQASSPGISRIQGMGSLSKQNFITGSLLVD